MSDALYEPGSKVRMSGAFTSLGVDTDPTTITLKVKDPTGVTTTYTYGVEAIVKDSTGHYHFDLIVTYVGRWFYKWSGTGTIAATNEETFRVRNQVIS